MSTNFFQFIGRIAMKGAIVSLLGALVVSCSGCGGGSEGQSAPTATSAQVAPTGSALVAIAASPYADGRASASWRLPISDYGIILRHGTAPDGSDSQGARDAFVYQAAGTYYMHYDGSSGSGPWNKVLATSTDLLKWTVKGNFMPLGKGADQDVDCVCYGTVMFDGSQYQMYYTGSTSQLPAPAIVPLAPYTTLRAVSTSPSGPWTKMGVPFSPKAGSYFADTASPGQVLKTSDGYLQFFAAGQKSGGKMLRTIGIARAPTAAGPWTVDETPILPSSEQIENAVFYFQPSSKQWFMFVNHVGVSPDGAREFSDAVWMYWTSDLNHWTAANRAVVVDGSSSSWAKAVIGLPSVSVKDGKLAVIYDGSSTATNMPDVSDNLNRDIGLAWVSLPITTPTQ